MAYHSKIEVVGDADKIYRCFSTESMEKERSNFSIRKSKNKVVFEIKAKDAVAFRATMNMITQLLTVYEKVKKIEHEN